MLHLPLMKIAIQGQIGSFHDQAVKQLFPDENYEIVGKDSFAEVFESLAKRSVDQAVVAVENSLFGALHETYDQLLKYNLTIIGETSVEIEQHLISSPGTKLEDILEVSSHPAALDQCRKFLSSKLPNAQLIEHADTAGAVADLAKDRLANRAAIASKRAAEIYNMNILVSNIEDEPNNITRFIHLSPEPVNISNANKATMILQTSHKPGALHEALGVFVDNDCNLTKLESRPVRGEPFKYQFIIDTMADQQQLISLVHELEQLDCSIDLLGHYKTNLLANN